MHKSNLNLAALIGSRICHDLISPIGAISNGLELLSLAGEQQGPEMKLIAESIKNANARIRFFRIAYGPPSDAQILSYGEVNSILSGISHGSRLTVDWSVSDDQSRSNVQFAFLALQCLETAMPYGGHVTVCANGTYMHLVGNGQKLLRESPLWAAFHEPALTLELMPSQVQFAMLPLLAAEQNRDLHINIQEQQIEMSFSCECCLSPPQCT